MCIDTLKAVSLYPFIEFSLVLHNVPVSGGDWPSAGLAG
jgi:hypothetical protein